MCKLRNFRSCNFDQRLLTICAALGPLPPTTASTGALSKFVPSLHPTLRTFALSRSGWLVLVLPNEKSIRVPHSGTWLQLNATVGKDQKATRAQYSVYSSAQRDSNYLGTDSYSLPKAIAPHVDFIVPGVSFAQLEGASPKRSPRTVKLRQDSKAGAAAGE